jgi:N-acetylmuramoyl-L-alanine amidase
MQHGMSADGGEGSAGLFGRGRRGPDVLGIAGRVLVVVTCISAAVAMIRGFSATASPSPATATLTEEGSQATPAATGPSGDTASTGTPAGPRIGIVAGHSGSDPGAVCPDGLSEADVNLDIAQRVVNMLWALGYDVDLLEEFDPGLDGYAADVLISIHADTCEEFPDATPAASGFKVASVADSAVPEAEQRLVACLTERYAARTGLYYHEGSVTAHMTQYHSFYEIDPNTPAAIIEAGFLLADREILTTEAHVVADGIVDGILCFLEN